MNLLAYSPEKSFLQQAIDKNIRLLHPYANLKNISIENSRDMDVQVIADKDMLDFILRNLLSNAIKFSHKNSVIKIDSPVKGDEITINISDTGIGMAEEKL